ncbi:S-layer protein [Saliphagus sp. GCM10025334]
METTTTTSKNNIGDNTTMKRISKTGKAVAGSALLLGATLVGAAGAASADLGDYPSPFVDDEGQVDSSIVVGDEAATVDVVGAINVAGSLSQAAYTTVEGTVDAQGTPGWSASNGVTLATVNQNLFFGDAISDVRGTLTSSDLESLESVTFTDDAGEDYDIDYYNRVGDASVTFGQSPHMEDEEEDPALYVPVSDDAESSPLYTLEAVFSTGVDFTSGDVAGEDIELFGQTYTVATDMETGEEETAPSELVLWGSSETLNLETGESGTFELDGTEHTVEVRYIDGDSVTLRVNGEPENVDEEDTFRVDGQDVRVSGLYPEGDGEGLAQFQIGSDEIVLSDGEPIEDDGETVDGTQVYFNGDHDNGDGSEVTDFSTEVSTIEVNVAAEDDENDAILAGESFTHSFFENVEVHFGGLNPDAASADDMAEVDFATNDEVAEVTVTDNSGNTETIEFATDVTDVDGNSDNVVELVNEDGSIVNADAGDSLVEGDLFITDAGGFSNMYEVTNADLTTSETGDATGEFETDEEGTIELENVFTGNTVEVDVDSGAQTAEKIINGQTYTFNVEDTNDQFNIEGWSTPDQRPDSANGAALQLENGAYLDFDYTNVGAVIHEEDGGSFTITPTGADNDEEISLSFEDGDYDGDHVQTAELESDSDVTAGYTGFGSYVEVDDSDEGEVELRVPGAQAAAGVAVTGAEGSVSSEGGASVTYEESSPAGWPDSSALDTDSDIDEKKTSQNMILVGGPAVNALTAELADEGLTAAQADYEEGDQRLDYVEGAFHDDYDALVVSGYSGEDTRSVANYLSNYADHQDELEGQASVNLQTMTEETAE